MIKKILLTTAVCLFFPGCSSQKDSNIPGYTESEVLSENFFFSEEDIPEEITSFETFGDEPFEGTGYNPDGLPEEE